MRIASRMRPEGRTWGHGPILAMLLLLLLSSDASAVTYYYVDPGASGSATGAASNPWQSLGTSEWSTINTALASDAVTVYFSARAAGSDVDQATTTALSIRRTDGSSNRLTLDGMSQYNTSDSMPSWSAYSGTSRFAITANNPAATLNAENSNVTLKGFRIVATEGQIILWWGGSNVIIEDNDGSHAASGVTYGPGLYYQYTNEESSSCPTASGRESCVAYTNITIRRNYIHDTYAEGIYLGGCGNMSGCLSHDGVVIEENVLRNIAGRGGEPDAIDIKDGIRNLVIRYNDIRLQTDSRDGITLESGAIIERNYIEGAGRIGIALNEFWNSSGATRAGTIVRNNLIINSGGNTQSLYSRSAGIYIEDAGTGDQFSGVGIFNNTIYRVVDDTGTEGTGMVIGSATTTIQNNIIAETEDLPLDAASGTLATHSHNLFYRDGTTAGVAKYGSTTYTPATLSTFEATSISASPQFIDTASPYAPEHFRLRSTSPAVGLGTTLGSFSTDYFGLTRVEPWELGAVEIDARAPAGPTGIRVVP